MTGGYIYQILPKNFLNFTFPKYVHKNLQKQKFVLSSYQTSIIQQYSPQLSEKYKIILRILLSRMFKLLQWLGKE